MYPKFQKLSKCTIGLISTILIIIALYCFFNNWMYYFFDIGVKAISGIGAILAGLFVYVKWQDEKTRSLFEKSLQEVYAPLISILIKQETYRQIACPNITPKDSPILTIKVTNDHKTINFSSSGLAINETTETHPGILDRNKFFNIIKKDSYGLASPRLLSCLNKYELLLTLQEGLVEKISSVYPNFQSVEEVYKTAMQSPDGIQLAHVSDSRYSTEVDLIQEISDGYNYCINKLGMYDQVLDMTISKE